MSQGDTREVSKAHKRGPIPGPVHPAEGTSKAREQSSIPGPALPAEVVTAEAPQSPKMPLGFWDRFIARIRKAVTKSRRDK